MAFTEEFSIKHEQEHIDGIRAFDNQWRVTRTELSLRAAWNI